MREIISLHRGAAPSPPPPVEALWEDNDIDVAPRPLISIHIEETTPKDSTSSQSSTVWDLLDLEIGLRRPHLKNERDSCGAAVDEMNRSSREFVVRPRPTKILDCETIQVNHQVATRGVVTEWDQARLRPQPMYRCAQASDEEAGSYHLTPRAIVICPQQFSAPCLTFARGYSQLDGSAYDQEEVLRSIQREIDSAADYSREILRRQHCSKLAESGGVGGGEPLHQQQQLLPFPLFHLHHSLEGGMGSGYTTKLLELMADEGVCRRFFSSSQDESGVSSSSSVPDSSSRSMLLHHDHTLLISSVGDLQLPRPDNLATCIAPLNVLLGLYHQANIFGASLSPSVAAPSSTSVETPQIPRVLLEDSGILRSTVLASSGASNVDHYKACVISQLTQTHRFKTFRNQGYCIGASSRRMGAGPTYERLTSSHYPTWSVVYSPSLVQSPSFSTQLGGERSGSSSFGTQDEKKKMQKIFNRALDDDSIASSGIGSAAFRCHHHSHHHSDTPIPRNHDCYLSNEDEEDGTYDEGQAYPKQRSFPKKEDAFIREMRTGFTLSKFIHSRGFYDESTYKHNAAVTWTQSGRCGARFFQQYDFAPTSRTNLWNVCHFPVLTSNNNPSAAGGTPSSSWCLNDQANQMMVLTSGSHVEPLARHLLNCVDKCLSEAPPRCITQVKDVFSRDGLESLDQITEAREWLVNQVVEMNECDESMINPATSGAEDAEEY